MRAQLLLATLAVPPVACGLTSGSSEDPGADETMGQRGAHRDPQTVIVGRPADAISLDPARISDNESVEVVEQIYDKLLQYEPGDDEIEPGLATSWEVSDDGRVWTLQLRRGVKFHDGTTFDAEAVVFSFERQRDESHPYHRDDESGLSFRYWASTYQNIQKVEALGKYTVRITIERRYAPFEANLAMFPVAIVSPAAVKKHGGDYYEHPVGTGPFELERWEGGRIVLERNDDYWGPRPEIERLVYRSMPDGRQRLVALESGAIDVAYSIPPEELQFVALHPQLVLYRTAANNVTYLAMNETRPPFDDVRVRQAANHAVNKKPIVKLAYQGLAVPAFGPLPPTQWGHHETDSRYPYDPARARALLDQAAADDSFDPEEVYELYVSHTPRPYLPDPEGVARVLQANLAEVGIRTKLVFQGFRAHLASVKRSEHDLCLHGWVGDNGDPDNFLYVLFDSENAVPGLARNYAFYRDPELDELLIAAQRSESREQREEIYARAQERIAAQAPWVPIAHSQVAVAARADIGGISIKPNTQIDFTHVKRLGK